MTVADLINELYRYNQKAEVGILYDMQSGFYPAFEVQEIDEHGTHYIAICDKP